MMAIGLSILSILLTLVNSRSRSLNKIVGVYTWESRDGENALTLCESRREKRLYAGIFRDSKIPDLEPGITLILEAIGRTKKYYYNSDGFSAKFNDAIRRDDAVGINDITFKFKFNKHKGYSIELNDERYKLTKISKKITSPYICVIPKQKFRDLLGSDKKIESLSPPIAPFPGLAFRARLERQGNHYTGCYRFEDEDSGDIVDGAPFGEYLGNDGVNGRLIWEGRVLITEFENVGPPCDTGIVFMITKENGYFDAWRCSNIVTFGAIFENLVEVDITQPSNPFCPLVMP